MRIIFAGTPDVAVPSLATMYSEHDVVAVLTRPDAPVGRSRVLTPSPVAEFAATRGLHVIKASRMTVDVERTLRELHPDLGVVVAYGALIPSTGLEIPARGWINLHFSKLPNWRGAAPVQRALIAGEQSTALTVFRLVEKLDAGDVVVSEAVTFVGDETAGMALTRFSVEGANVVSRAVNAIDDGIAIFTPQAGQASYAHKLTDDDGRLRPHETASQSYNRYRGVTPEPGAWLQTSLGRLKVLECSALTDMQATAGRLVRGRDTVAVGFASGALALRRVQPAGGRPMEASAWARGISQPDAWVFE